jgi:hypothetical protein
MPAGIDAFDGEMRASIFHSLHFALDCVVEKTQMA